MLNLCPQEKHIFFLLLSWAEKKDLLAAPERDILFSKVVCLTKTLEKIEQKKSVRAFKQKHKRPIENHLSILTCFYSSEHMCSYY